MRDWKKEKCSVYQSDRFEEYGIAPKELIGEDRYTTLVGKGSYTSLVCENRYTTLVGKATHTAFLG